MSQAQVTHHVMQFGRAQAELRMGTLTGQNVQLGPVEVAIGQQGQRDDMSCGLRTVARAATQGVGSSE